MPDDRRCLFIFTIMEIWKDIKGYEGLYQVSNLGNVKSLCYRGGRLSRIMKQQLGNCGYYLVTLYIDGIKKTNRIHRLVGQAFISNPDNKPEIDHINTIRTDNRAANLRWVTHRENQNNPLSMCKNSIRKTGQKHHNYGKFGKLHHSSIPIIQYSKDGEFIAEFAGMWEAKRMTGINNGCISSACKGNRPTAGGYVWKYKN